MGGNLMIFWFPPIFLQFQRVYVKLIYFLFALKCSLYITCSMA